MSVYVPTRALRGKGAAAPSSLSAGRTLVSLATCSLSPAAPAAPSFAFFRASAASEASLL